MQKVHQCSVLPESDLHGKFDMIVCIHTAVTFEHNSFCGLEKQKLIYRRTLLLMTYL